MKTLTPQIIAEITGGAFVGNDRDRNAIVTGAVRDNRDVKQGNLFICIRGAHADGHAYMNAAYESGAACCLTEREIPESKGPYVIVESTLESIKTIAGYYRSFFNIPVIGVTGSVGKTTIKELIASVLNNKLCVLKTEMNMNNELGVPLTLLSLNESHEAAVIEMGISEFGEMSRLAKIVRPDIFVMTKIGYAHIKELGDLKGVLRAKAEAFEYMDSNGIAILNGDDELLLRYDPKIQKITFGLEGHNDVRAVNIKPESVNRVQFDILSNGRIQNSENIKNLIIPAYGSHLAELAPAAVITGWLLGLTSDEIKNGFKTYGPVKGRSKVIEKSDITVIDDCYNANPNSLKAALASMSALPGRHVAILGDMLNMGEESSQMHNDIGTFATKSGINCLICQGPQSRYIYEGYMENGGIDANYYPEMSDLIFDLSTKIKKGDVILVKASRDMEFKNIVDCLINKQLK